MIWQCRPTVLVKVKETLNTVLVEILPRVVKIVRFELKSLKSGVGMLINNAHHHPRQVQL